MIFGIGIDIVKIDRIKRLMQNKRFFSRVFTAGEIALFEACHFRLETVAGRFAAKEAILKSLGLGLCDVPLSAIEVLRSKNGQPYVALCGAAHEHAQSLGVGRIHISISHDGGLAVAQAIAEGE